MKITRIRTVKTHSPYGDGSYGWGARHAIEVAQTSVVTIDSDASLQRVGDIDGVGQGVAPTRPDEKAMAEAKQGLQVDHEIRVAHATRDLGDIPEQPCRNYEGCQQGRRVAEICCLKISNLGGRVARNARPFATNTPGLGTSPDFESLDAPIAEYSL